MSSAGWNEGSTRFSPLVASTNRRAQLIKNIIKFLRKNKFDGLDLNWGMQNEPRAARCHKVAYGVV